jgi:hypothetical protein
MLTDENILLPNWPVFSIEKIQALEIQIRRRREMVSRRFFHIIIGHRIVLRSWWLRPANSTVSP